MKLQDQFHFSEFDHSTAERLRLLVCQLRSLPSVNQPDVQVIDGDEVSVVEEIQHRIIAEHQRLAEEFTGMPVRWEWIVARGIGGHGDEVIIVDTELRREPADSTGRIRYGFTVRRIAERSYQLYE